MTGLRGALVVCLLGAAACGGPATHEGAGAAERAAAGRTRSALEPLQVVPVDDLRALPEALRPRARFLGWLVGASTPVAPIGSDPADPASWAVVGRAVVSVPPAVRQAREAVAGELIAAMADDLSLQTRGWVEPFTGEPWARATPLPVPAAQVQQAWRDRLATELVGALHWVGWRAEAGDDEDAVLAEVVADLQAAADASEDDTGAALWLAVARSALRQSVADPPSTHPGTPWDQALAVLDRAEADALVYPDDPVARAVLEDAAAFARAIGALGSVAEATRSRTPGGDRAVVGQGWSTDRGYRFTILGAGGGVGAAEELARVRDLLPAPDVVRLAPAAPRDPGAAPSRGAFGWPADVAVPTVTTFTARTEDVDGVSDTRLTAHDTVQLRADARGWTVHLVPGEVTAETVDGDGRPLQPSPLDRAVDAYSRPLPMTWRLDPDGGLLDVDGAALLAEAKRRHASVRAELVAAIGEDADDVQRFSWIADDEDRVDLDRALLQQEHARLVDVWRGATLEVGEVIPYDTTDLGPLDAEPMAYRGVGTVEAKVPCDGKGPPRCVRVVLDATPAPTPLQQALAVWSDDPDRLPDAPVHLPIAAGHTVTTVILDPKGLVPWSVDRTIRTAVARAGDDGVHRWERRTEAHRAEAWSWDAAVPLPGEATATPEQTLQTVPIQAGFVTLPDGSAAPVRSFLARAREVTGQEWVDIVGVPRPEEDTLAAASTRPATEVAFLEALVFANARSVRDGLTPAYAIGSRAVRWDRAADGWRLPTPTEWLWMAHAAQPGHQAWGVATGPSACRTANLFDASAATTSRRQTSVDCSDGAATLAPVGTREASPLGLYDVVGNARELVWADGEDLWAPEVAELATKVHTVALGLTWSDDWQADPVETARAERMGWGAPDTGLRLVRTPADGGEAPSADLAANAQAEPLPSPVLVGDVVVAVAPLAVLPPSGRIAADEAERMHAVMVDAARATGGRFVDVLDAATTRARLAQAPALGPCPDGPGRGPCMRRVMQRLGVLFVGTAEVEDRHGDLSYALRLYADTESVMQASTHASAPSGTLEVAGFERAGAFYAEQAARRAGGQPEALLGQHETTFRMHDYAAGAVPSAAKKAREEADKAAHSWSWAAMDAFATAAGRLPYPLPHAKALPLPSGVSVLVVFDPDDDKQTPRVAAQSGLVDTFGVYGVHVVALARGDGTLPSLPFPVVRDPGVLDAAMIDGLQLRPPFLLIVRDGTVAWVGSIGMFKEGALQAVLMGTIGDDTLVPTLKWKEWAAAHGG